MTKTSGHIIVGTGDLLAVAALYWVYSEHSQLMSMMDSGASIISFNNKLYMLLGMILVPAVHTIAIIEAFWPKVFDRITKPATIIMVSYLVFVLILPVFVSNSYENKLLKSGYSLCKEGSFYGTISKTLVYVKSRELCKKDML